MQHEFSPMFHLLFIYSVTQVLRIEKESDTSGTWNIVLDTSGVATKTQLFILSTQAPSFSLLSTSR
jgi:hypothetical protein